ncbi:MAG: hypothetical protein RSA17_10680, partial [Ruthenibacterium sp.]
SEQGFVLLAFFLMKNDKNAPCHRLIVDDRARFLKLYRTLCITARTRQGKRSPCKILPLSCGPLPVSQFS